MESIGFMVGKMHEIRSTTPGARDLTKQSLETTYFVVAVVLEVVELVHHTVRS